MELEHFHAAVLLLKDLSIFNAAGSSSSDDLIFSAQLNYACKDMNEGPGMRHDPGRSTHVSQHEEIKTLPTSRAHTRGKQTQLEGRAGRCLHISAASDSKPNPTISSRRWTSSITHRVTCQLASERAP